MSIYFELPRQTLLPKKVSEITESGLYFVFSSKVDIDGCECQKDFDKCGEYVYILESLKFCHGDKLVIGSIKAPKLVKYGPTSVTIPVIPVDKVINDEVEEYFAKSQSKETIPTLVSLSYSNLEENLKKNGCPFRKWGWHDGGNDFGCLWEGQNYSCKNHYDNYYKCEKSDDRWNRYKDSL